MKQLPLAIAPEPAQSFANFLPGANAAVLAHLAALAPGAPPVYLWGPPGSGKTHLLRAGALRAHDQGRHTAAFAAAVPAPWPPLEARVDWIVLDDCESLDAAQQAAAFSLFVAAVERQAIVVAAGRVPPVDLAGRGYREDLRTRLGWGHVFALEPLGEAEVRAALRREADRRGTFFSDDVMDYLLTRFARDLAHLMRQLDRLDAFSLSTQRVITIPLLKQMLAEEGAA